MFNMQLTARISSIRGNAQPAPTHIVRSRSIGLAHVAAASPIFAKGPQNLISQLSDRRRQRGPSTSQKARDSFQ